VRDLLTGGDRRSIARANDVLAMARKDAALVSELALLAADDNWLVAQRALDVLEKLAREQPERVERYKDVFVGKAADSDQWEVRLQVVRALALFEWPSRSRKRALQILLRDIEHPQTFVRAWALDSLATFAVKDRRLMPVVGEYLTAFEHSQRPALVARAKHIRARLSRI
jgi:hypothetical protein